MHINAALLTSNVSASAGRNGNFYDVSHFSADLVVAVDVVRYLHEDPGPVERVDGAKVVLVLVGPVAKNGLDGDVEVVGCSLDLKNY